MVLLYGPDPRWADAFYDEDAHRDGWIRNRHRLLAWYRHGRRPMGWWRYESLIKYPGYANEPALLFELDLLEPQERAELLDTWRRHFERAFEPDFFHCSGPGRILYGAEARRAHFKWLGLPQSLLKEWLRSRPRRARRSGETDPILNREETPAQAPPAA
jgi:hypothetical protein